MAKKASEPKSNKGSPPWLLEKKDFIFLAVIGIIFSVICIKGFAWEFSDQNAYYYMGELISQGNLPYRDFFFSHPPGEIYINALIFNIFGASLLAFKLFSLLPILLSAIIIYLIAKKNFGKIEAYLSSAIFLLTYETIRIASGNLGMGYATLLIVIAVWLCLENKHFLSGISFGLASMIVFHAIPAFCAGFLFSFVSFENSKMKLSFSKAGKILAGFAISFGLITLVLMIIFGGSYFSQVVSYHLNKPASALPNIKFGLLLEMIKYNVLVFLPLILLVFRKKETKAITQTNNTHFFWIATIIYSVYLFLLGVIFPYYFFSLFPFLVILSGLGIGKIIERYDLKNSAFAIAIITLLFFANLAFAVSQYYWTTNKSNIDELIDNMGKRMNSNNKVFGDYLFVPAIAFNSNQKVVGNIIDTNPLVFQAGVIDFASLTKKLENEPSHYMVLRQGNNFMLQSNVTKTYLNDRCKLLKSWDFYFPSYFRRGLVQDKVFLVECKNK